MDEDDTLLKYLKEVRHLGWREISLHFKNRTANGCQFRWRRISALAKTIKGKDSEEGEVESEETEQNSQQVESNEIVDEVVVKKEEEDDEIKAGKRENSLEKLLN